MAHFDCDGIRGGVWHGRLSGAGAPPRLVLVHHGDALAEAHLTPEGEGWRVEMPVPAAILSGGVQTLLLVASGAQAEAEGATLADPEVLARLPLIVGQPLHADFLAEMDALRAELELVKRELRRIGAAQG